MRMTYSSFMQFYENVDMSMLWSIWSPWRNEKGATAAKRKWCHGNIRVPVTRLRYRCKREVWRERVMQDGGCSRIPGSHETVARQKRGIPRTIRTRSKHRVHLIQHTYIHGRSSHRYTFEACVFGAERVRCGVDGSRRSRVVVGSSCSHGNGSGSSRYRDGSGSSGTRRRR